MAERLPLLIATDAHCNDSSGRADGCAGLAGRFPGGRRAVGRCPTSAATPRSARTLTSRAARPTSRPPTDCCAPSSPTVGAAGCDGRLPATLIGVNEIVLAEDVNTRGLRATANPRFVKPSGGAAPVLHEGQKIVFGDFECAVGSRSAHGLHQGSARHAVDGRVPRRAPAIGPATEGLPPGFPDPNDFVVGDDTYVVGTGAKNLFPVFTVDGGLTCSIIIYSGGEIGCDGPLPARHRRREPGLHAAPGRCSGIRRADDPKFSTPAYPGHIRQLPVGYRINGNRLHLHGHQGRRGVLRHARGCDAGLPGLTRGDHDVPRVSSVPHVKGGHRWIAGSVACRVALVGVLAVAGSLTAGPAPRAVGIARDR